MHSVILHILNEDPVVGEIDELPGPSTFMITVHNPRKRDGKDVNYIEPNVSTVIWPVTRVNFIEVMPSNEEEEIITFVRE